MSMPAGFKADKGYATVTDFPGSMDYRSVAERMSSDGDRMNHSTARNVFLRAMKKLVVNMHELYGLELDVAQIERSAKDPDFQRGIYEIMLDLDELRENSNV